MAMPIGTSFTRASEHTAPCRPPSSNPASAKAYMQDHRLLYPSLSDSGDRIAAEFNRLIPISDFPSTLVISPDGRIAGRVIGAASVLDLSRLIKAAA